jgi:hypothetical protein
VRGLRECRHAEHPETVVRWLITGQHVGCRLSRLDPEHRVERLDPVHWVGRLDSLDRVGRLAFVYRVGWLGGLRVFGRFRRECAVDSVRLLASVDPGLAGGWHGRFAGAPEGMTPGEIER